MAATFLAVLTLTLALAVSVHAANTATAAWTQTQFNGSDAGACGYGPLKKTAYGGLNFAASAPVFSGGAACGECFRFTCSVAGICSSGGVVAALTDECSGTATCPPTAVGFSLSGVAFGAMAVPGKENALRNMGKTTVTYTRVPCAFRSYIHFQVLASFSRYYFPLNVAGVNGPGAITGVSIRGSADSAFTALKRSWGEVWALPSGASPQGPIAVQITATLAGKTALLACPGRIPASFALATFYTCGAQFPLHL